MGAEERRAELERWYRLLRASFLLTVPVFLTAMVLPMFPAFRPALNLMVLGFPLEELVKWGFTTPIQFCIASRFHIGAWKALRGRRWESGSSLPFKCKPQTRRCFLLKCSLDVHTEGRVASLV